MAQMLDKIGYQGEPWRSRRRALRRDRSAGHRRAVVARIRRVSTRSPSSSARWPASRGGGSIELLVHTPPDVLDDRTAAENAAPYLRHVRELAEHGTTVVLTTQHLEEAEQLADWIAILHSGQIIVNGTLAELKQLLPPAKVAYIEKQPTLEDVFLAIVGGDGKDGDEGHDRNVGTDR